MAIGAVGRSPDTTSIRLRALPPTGHFRRHLDLAINGSAP